MTNPFALDKTELDRLGPREAIGMDLRQFRRLQHLCDEDVAHRMARSVKEVRDLRRQFGSTKVRLTEVGLPYQIRLILGRANIKTIGQLQARTDAQLLALPLLGKKRLEETREIIKNFLESIQ